mmetsp:Transcript_20685/g.37347  ORF Transcript_20685/g.37347 Transcript_20685/m.37347 type:complete len:441 (-) Transcript_20685:426-1748(-)
MTTYVIIDFEVKCETNEGEHVVITGDHLALGDWDEDKGVKLQTSDETYPLWSSLRPLLVEVPMGETETEVQYKIAKVKSGEDAIFEELDANRCIKVTSNAAGFACTVKAVFGEPEKEPLRIPKFSPPARCSGSKDKARLGSKDKSNYGSWPLVKSAEKENEQSLASIKRITSGVGLDFQMQATKSGKEVSFWHDVPLFPVSENAKVKKNHVNFVCEIPKTTRKKFEVSTKGEGNPIKQDTKNGKLREYSKGDIWFNYGCLPRTWEDTEFVHPDVGFPGDGDPLDACEIGMRMFETGAIRETKVLGVLCMIDEDETDWKLVCIDVEDRWAPELNNVEDVDRLLPGALDQIREWWRTYKVTDGKPLNKFGLGEKFMPAEYAMEVVVECHEAWRKACAKQAEEEEPEPDSPKTPKLKSRLSFSKLEDLDMNTDKCALQKLLGA